MAKPHKWDEIFRGEKAQKCGVAHISYDAISAITPSDFLEEAIALQEAYINALWRQVQEATCNSKPGLALSLTQQANRSEEFFKENRHKFFTSAGLIK